VGFDILKKKDPEFRGQLSEDDYAYLSNCKMCEVRDLCGGWSVYNDGRWCDGPGDVCFDGCRAICSKNMLKVSKYAEMLGEGNYYTAEDGWTVPKLDIVGTAPWESWKLEWPDVGFQINAHVDGKHQHLYTISLKQLYYPDTDSWSKKLDLRERYQIPDTSVVAITTTVADSILDPLVTDLERHIEALTKFEGVDFIFAPNLSVYDNYPRLDNLFRIKQKWVMMDLIQEYGMRVVPDICFVNSKDFMNQYTWMRDNKADCMLFNFQVQAAVTGTDVWDSQVRGAVAMRDKLGYPVQLIAYGGVGGARMQDIIDKYGPGVTFIDAKSYRLAEFHKSLDGTVDADTPVKDLFQRNASERRRQVAKAKGLPAFPPMTHHESLRFG
jgi:hypothetical protein